jgi:hypothetical protein
VCEASEKMEIVLMVVVMVMMGIITAASTARRTIS